MANRKGSQRKKKKSLAKDPRILAAAGVILLAAVLLILFLRGCGLSHRSPEHIVEALVKAGIRGDEKAMKDCYGVRTEGPAELQEEVKARIQYYKAHNADRLSIRECGRLFEEEDNVCIYVIYDLRLEDGQDYPCCETFMTQKREGSFYVLTPEQVTEDMQDTSSVHYEAFMDTEAYRSYAKEYDTFIRKNPGYEDKIAGKLKS